MKSKILILTLLLFVIQLTGEIIVPLVPRLSPQPPPPAQPSLIREEVQLLDGDALGGKFLGFDASKGILWKHPAIAELMHIDPAKVKRITLPNGRLPANARHHSGQVRIFNGDVIHGDNILLKDGKLSIETWYAGRLTFRKEGIQSLVPGHPAQVILAGPEAMKGWVATSKEAAEIFKGTGGVLPEEILKRIYAQNQATRDGTKAGWKVKGNSLVNRTGGGVIGRDIDLPGRAKIVFDLEKVPTAGFKMNLFAENLRSGKIKNGYSLTITPTTIQLIRHEERNGSVQTTTLTNVRDLAPIMLVGKQRISIFINQRAEELFITFSNKTRFFTCMGKGKKAFVGKGNGVVFQNPSSSPIRISNFRVSHWDGQGPGKAKMPTHSGKDDLAVLVNGDRLQGQVLGIGDGKLVMRSDFGELPMPLNRVQAIYFGKPKAPPSRPGPGGVRLNLKDGGALTAELLEWTDAVVKVKSPLFGEVKLNAGIISGIEFVLNPPEKKTANAGIKDKKGVIFPDIIFVQDNINLDDLDGVPDAWLVEPGFVFPRLKINPNLPKLNR